MTVKDRDHSFVSLNFLFGLADDSKNSWQNRKHLATEMLLRYPTDFLGIQESNHFQTRFWHKRCRIIISSAGTTL